MSYFKNTTDASKIYTPSSDAGNNNLNRTAVTGNLFDVMKNRTIIRVEQQTPVSPINSKPHTKTAVKDTF